MVDSESEDSSVQLVQQVVSVEPLLSVDVDAWKERSMTIRELCLADLLGLVRHSIVAALDQSYEIMLKACSSYADFCSAGSMD